MPTYIPPTLETIELEGYTFDPGYYLSGDYLDIESACKELPPIIEWINEKLQTFIEQKMMTDQLIKRARATAYFRLRSGELLEIYNVTKITESSICQAVELDREVQRLEEEYCKLYAWCHRLGSIQASLRDKLNLVRTAESTRRALLSSVGSDEAN